MATLKISYCQLIRIILAQIGGSPLQQLYTQLTAGMPNIIRGGPIPAELAQIKQLIDTVTAALAEATAVINDFNNLATELQKQFFQNPLASSITAARAAISSRQAQLDCSGAGAGSEECVALADMDSQLVTLATNTNLLSGVTAPSGDNGAQCSLQDLLGNGCTKNTDVPDVDLQNIYNILTKKQDLDRLVTDIERAVANSLGFTAFQSQLNTLKNTFTNFNTSFRLTVNKAAIKNAVIAQINSIVFHLLSGCGNNVLAETIKPDIKTKLQPFVEYMAKLQEGSLYTTETGKTVSTTGETVTLSDGTKIATLTSDGLGNTNDPNVINNTTIG